MIPLSDDNPTLRTPVVTIALLVVIGITWIFFQGAGLDPRALAVSICNYGLVAGEVTRTAPVGTAVEVASRMYCVVDDDPVNYVTPVTSMFLHGGWAHVLGNGLFLWVFGNNVEDSMGRGRYLAFYLLCGLAAAALQVAVTPASPVPMVGASGAISGVLGAYLLLYPRVRVNMLFIFFIFFRIIPLPAYVVLLSWIGLQLLAGIPQLLSVNPDVSSGVAFFAHIGGFIAGMIFVRPFCDTRRLRTRDRIRHELHPGHP